MLRADPAEFFLFLSFTCNILGYVSRKWCKNSPFYLLCIFSRRTGATMFLRSMMGPPLDMPLCRAEQVRKFNERERSRSRAWKKIWWSGKVEEREQSGERGLQKEAWAVSGNFDRSRSAHMLWLGYRKFLLKILTLTHLIVYKIIDIIYIFYAVTVSMVTVCHGKCQFSISKCLWRAISDLWMT